MRCCSWRCCRDSSDRPSGLIIASTIAVAAFVYVELTHSPISIPLGLCPDWAEWDPNQPVQNAREAMQQADDWLGVPQVRCIVGLGSK